MAHLHRLTPNDEVEIRPDPKTGWVPGWVSYAGEHEGHYVIDTKDHGRFTIPRGHEDLRLPPSS